MSITPRGMSVQEAYRLFRDNKLLVNRKYQRKLVWTLEEKQSLIDSIIKDYPIPLILLAETTNDGVLVYEIIDGMQRLNAVFSFIENYYSINDKYFDVNEFSRAKQAAEAGLFKPIDDQKILILARKCADILDYQLAVTIFPVASEQEVTDIFGRINSGGRQLSSQDKRQAGMVDDFSLLVRVLASEIRGDSSIEKLPLSSMPEISIDSNRFDLGYSLKAEDIFWCKQGIIWAKQLRDSEDEEMIVDICASIVLGEPIAKSKELFDKIYNKQSDYYLTLRRALASYGPERLVEEIKTVFSVLQEVIRKYSDGANVLRSIVNPSSNPIKTSFFSIFMAFYRLVIQEEKTPEDYLKIMEALRGLQKVMISSANYATVEDRIKNIDKTVGLIQRYFVRKDPPMLRHGAGLAIDMENSLRRSRLETSRYECKQGILSLSTTREIDKEIFGKFIQTICGIANVGPDSDGFIFIGVADNEKDANRIQSLDSIEPKIISTRYVVGVEREMVILGVKPEQYLEKIIGSLRSSTLSEPLKSQILSQIDYVEYKGLSVIRIRVPSQKEISFVEDKAYIRENSSTIEVSGKKLLALNGLFS